MGEKEIVIVSFTGKGALTAKKIENILEKIGYTAKSYSKKQASSELMLLPLDKSLGEWTRENFSKAALIFVGATGIAVRAIAPYIKGKTVDPAVLVVDERGNYVISLLSGHIGGANRLAEQIAAALNALPIITTATDINGKFAVDEWAKRQGLSISDMKLAKKVSAALLEEKTVGFFSEIPTVNSPPPELKQEGPGGLGIAVTVKEEIKFYEETLYLRPRSLVLGIGCRRDTPFEKIERFVQESLKRENISWHAIDRVATIDIKQEEKGLLEFCEAHALPFEVYSAQELASVEGEFTPSSFVSSITGVDNVCERAAVKSSRGQLILKKSAREGVTLAIAEMKIYLHF